MAARSSLLLFDFLGKLIVDLQGRMGDGQVFQLGATRKVDGERDTSLELAMAASEDKGHRAEARGMTVDGLAQGQGEFLGAIVIEETEKLREQAGSRFPTLECLLEEGVAFRDQDDVSSAGGVTQGLAFLFQ